MAKTSKKSFKNAPKPSGELAPELLAFANGKATPEMNEKIKKIVIDHLEDDSTVQGVEVVGEGTEAKIALQTNYEPTKPTPKKMLVVGNEIITPDAEETSRLSIDLPKSMHRRYKAALAANGLKMRSELVKFIAGRLEDMEKKTT